MKRSRTSKAWMQEHVNDAFVKRANKEGYRARAAYKLMEIDDRDKLIKPGMTVVDLGATPGSWSQVAMEPSRITVACLHWTCWKCSPCPA